VTDEIAATLRAVAWYLERDCVPCAERQVEKAEQLGATKAQLEKARALVAEYSKAKSSS
jgi:hypothetical protein